MKTTINLKKLGRFRRSVLRRNVLCRSVLRRRVSGVTTAPATPAMQGGGTLGGRHITKLTVF